MRLLLCISVILFPAVVFSQSYYPDTSLNVNKHRFRIVIKELNEDKLLLIVKSNSRTVSVDTIENALSDFKMTDFNKDGYCDILLTYMGNPVSSLFLFDTAKSRFKRVADFEHYPEPLQLKAYPSFYYSYHKAGCADMYWVSDLFKIEHFKAIHIGQVYGQACDSPYYIIVYKIKANDEAKKSLVAKIPYSRVGGYKNDKWGFIDDYWNKNYLKFR